jgi:gamma-glutamylcyclotransferase (GGCT)/AIG2-like uncharacterized protein YtfP
VRWPLVAPLVDRWEPATVVGRLYDTGRGYPAACFDHDGEIDGYLVTFLPDRVDEAWATVDAIEGEGTLYRRVPVVTLDGVPAQSYRWAADVGGLVDLGRRWLGP